MTITELSIKRPPLIVVIFLFLIILGMFSYRLLKYELLPDITPPIISITSVYPGAPPGEVETSITKIVEDAVNSVEKIKRVNSFSLESVSLVVLEFTQSADANTSLQEVQRRINEILPSLPEDAETPVVSKFAINEMPVLRVGAVSDMPGREFYRFVDETIKPRLSRLEGVGAVTLFGGIRREIRVNVDQDKLKGYDIPILSVLETIKKANLDIPAGKVKDVQGQYSVRISGKLQAIETVQDLVIKDSPDHGPVKISDVAYVVDGTKEIESISRLNGKSALGILIQKQTGANSVEVCDRVKAELNKIEGEYTSNNITFDIAQDESVFTVESANNVKFDLMIAILLVGLVMLAFLHSIRNSLIIMVAIPCSLISTFIVMYLLGYTLN
ncbi:MAG TPA: efflux RND transporter permease subunit, partial [Balneolales bacterium]|nr:efflux RND transporter permease subunit [Balneolales bacterium]